MSNPLQRCTFTCIVRVWGEHLFHQPPAWRGIIKTYDRNEEIPFSNLEEMNQIIQRIARVELGLDNPDTNMASQSKWS